MDFPDFRRPRVHENQEEHQQQDLQREGRHQGDQEERDRAGDAVEGEVGCSVEAQNGHGVGNQSKQRFDGPRTGRQNKKVNEILAWAHWLEEIGKVKVAMKQLAQIDVP